MKTPFAPPSVRLHVAHLAAFAIVQRSWERAADLLETAVQLLPEVASLRLDRGDQQHALGRHFGLAALAASVALADPSRPPAEAAARALKILEFGRCILFSQVLETPSDLTELSARHPDLAKQFAAARARLDRDTGTITMGGVTVAAVDASTSASGDRHRLVAEYEQTLTKIRGLAGFETFLLQPEPEQLIRQAQYGPVVVVNVSPYGADALLVRSEGISAIPLPKLSTNDLGERFIGSIGRCEQHTIPAPPRRTGVMLRHPCAMCWSGFGMLSLSRSLTPWAISTLRRLARIGHDSGGCQMGSSACCRCTPPDITVTRRIRTVVVAP